MLKIQEIRELIKLVDQSSISEFEFEGDGAKISMKKGTLKTNGFEQPESVQHAAPAPVVEVKTESAPVVPAPKVEEKKPEALTVVEDDVNYHKIVSPMVGTFYKAPAPDAEPYVNVGDKVKENTVVCIVEAMKLMNEIEAEVRGEIVKVLVENGQLVEYGQPLFLVKPE
ncbi:acetyl-CoA carboxylase biotin carboxyl carrier protein [Microaerobacter geothermalis]|uniref:acetyl-CoA carboxylase biotin carboxyl carrier protein n=1 Tax=Microaerobacter geothermalis TaxID=674972 RepID=UPI001F319659|nr:acetyl-CoA carboxylase biotin carboxyl carrier protein [Microaerobacter geothermalis]MCF6094449.1 acetyl-CoA carboxylase biotin carboxyl carrier protein [Microaerobacter geothermalis]